MDDTAIIRGFDFAGQPALQAVGVAFLALGVPVRAAVVNAVAHAVDGAEGLVGRSHSWFSLKRRDALRFPALRAYFILSLFSKLCLAQRI